MKKELLNFILSLNFSAKREAYFYENLAVIFYNKNVEYKRI